MAEKELDLQRRASSRQLPSPRLRDRLGKGGGRWPGRMEESSLGNKAVLLWALFCKEGTYITLLVPDSLSLFATTPEMTLPVFLLWVLKGFGLQRLSWNKSAHKPLLMRIWRCQSRALQAEDRG